MDREQAKQKIAELVKKYEAVKNSGQDKKFTEEDTKKGFIEPLFRVLGWDIEDKNQVSTEEYIKSSGRVDYGFYINGRTKFYLEAKPFKANINDEDFSKQAIRYSWNKGITYAVLTNFETIKLFNAQAESKLLIDKLIFEIPCSEFEERFDELYLLSKEAFGNNSLDAYAEKHAKKFTKVTVNEKLFKDLKTIRENLTESFKSWNDKLQKPENAILLDEGVQKVIDRLVFIRVIEDKGLESPILIPLVREWENTGRKTSLYQLLVQNFGRLNDTYNSNVFAPHDSDNWEEHQDAVKNAIKLLQKSDSIHEYDFKYIPADILGGVYESYLGYIAQRGDIKTAEKKESRTKRKEHGIYYTPKFIVDYVLEQTLGKVLKKVNSIDELKKIKILDPACGSGSFLIKALDMIHDKYKDFNRGDPYVKIQILTENIYGVDLDPQAIELARLNLLINTVSEHVKLPNLGNNLKVGNSLLSGTDEELEKYFGKNFRDKNPFRWQERFPEVFKQGGFDVIIGNPPYIKESVNKSAFEGLHDSPYYQGKMDLWTMFACISIDLLKNNGLIGFIAPSSWVSNAGASIMRNKILTDGELKTFIDFGDYKVFEQAGIQTMVYVFEKKKPEPKYELNYLRINDKNILEEKLISEIFGNKIKIEINPTELKNKFLVFSENDEDALLKKIKSKSNYVINEKDVGNGIDVLQDFVTQNHLADLSDKTIKKGDGIFVVSDEEVKEISPTKNEISYLRPYYTTAEINRYLSNEDTNYKIIYADTYFREHIEEFPNFKKHLDKFSKILTSAYAPYGLHRARDEKFFNGDCIFSIRKTKRPAFSYVSFPCYVTRAFMILRLNKINPKYALGLFNSKLIYFWFRNKGKVQGDQLQIDKEPLLDAPLFIAEEERQKQIILLVDQIIFLNKKWHDTPEHSDQWESLKSEIEKTDQKIDQLVYKLYGLTDEEIKIVEDSNKK
jgi:adenine-specific DNA-methyltransferase